MNQTDIISACLFTTQLHLRTCTLKATVIGCVDVFVMLITMHSPSLTRSSRARTPVGQPFGRFSLLSLTPDPALLAAVPGVGRLLPRVREPRWRGVRDWGLLSASEYILVFGPNFTRRRPLGKLMTHGVTAAPPVDIEISQTMADDIYYVLCAVRNLLCGVEDAPCTQRLGSGLLPGARASTGLV